MTLLTDELARACSAAGLRIGVVRPLEGGYRGGNFVTTDAEGPLVLKLRPELRPLAIARSASHLMQERGLPHSLVVAGPMPTTAGWLLCTRWLPGVPVAAGAAAHWTSAQAAAFGDSFGRWLRRLHEIRTSQQLWLPRAEARFRSKIEDCRRRGLLEDDLTRWLERFWATAEPALRKAPVALVHRDLQPGNVIVEGDAFVGVIDLEQARLADPVYDLVKPHDEVIRMHPAIEPAFAAAYGLDTTSPDVRHRLDVVFVLEYLSAMVYFAKNGTDTDIADRRSRLRGLLGQSG
jgi:aminoglycoside phosphotransferase (APT) family kinase protein